MRTPKQSLVAIAAALILASCAAPPIVRVKHEDIAVAGASMEGAMRYMNSFRSTYNEAVIDQMERETGVSNVVIGAGALVTLLAAGKAGSDAILGAAAIGGTTYAVGRLSLPRLRVAVYQAGVEALDCAQQAATPFNVPDAQIKALASRLVALENARNTLDNVIAEATLIRAPLVKTAPDAVLLDASLATAATTRQAANNAMDAGLQYTGLLTGAAGQLVATVDRINSAVTRSLIEATPDLSAIKSQVGGMPEMIGLLAPSLQTRAAAGMDKINVAAAKSSLQSTPAEQVNQKLAVAVQEASKATDSVNAHLKTRVITGTPEVALKACGVAKVVTEMSVDSASLAFTAGTLTTLHVGFQGGIPPYRADFEGPRVDGVTKELFPEDKEVHVTVGAAVKGPHQLVLKISDGSSQRKTVRVPVTIAAAAPAPAASAPKPAAPVPKPAAAPAATTAATTIRNTNPFLHDGKSFGVISAVPNGTVITVAVQCPTGNAVKYPQTALASSLLTQASLSATPAWSLKFTGEACVAP